MHSSVERERVYAPAGWVHMCPHASPDCSPIWLCICVQPHQFFWPALTPPLATAAGGIAEVAIPPASSAAEVAGRVGACAEGTGDGARGGWPDAGGAAEGGGRPGGTLPGKLEFLCVQFCDLHVWHGLKWLACLHYAV